jgi:hypothetical protein
MCGRCALYQSIAAPLSQWKVLLRKGTSGKQ